MMEGFRVEIPLLKVKKEVILSFYEEKTPDLAMCKTCSEHIKYDGAGLQNHLKFHQVQWNLYLGKVSHVIMDSIPRSSGIDPMKLLAVIIDKNNTEFSLRFPLSRIQRDLSNLQVNHVLEGFDGRLQREYNYNCVGPYMGPYDQNKALPLSCQLSASSLDFDKYTQFIHPENQSCQIFSVKDTYEEVDDVCKLDCLHIEGDVKSDDKTVDEEEHVLYTCQHKGCKIPCPCSVCCTADEQCKEHRILHEEKFNEDDDMIAIRSINQFCNDGTFFDQCYLVRYPGIPLKCIKCSKDFLHHNCYHLEFHEDCKFCEKNSFKMYAETAYALATDMEKRDKFLKTVCPHCDSKFCEPYFRKKHVELEHDKTATFHCDFCPKEFHSKQAKVYHESSCHTDQVNKEICSTCGKEFSGKVNLLNHMKYVHSETRAYSCIVCDSKFKQKRDMRVHVLNVHGANISKAHYGNVENQEDFLCDVCDSSFKYKKNLNHHIRSKHETSNDAHKVQCDICSLNFTEEKCLHAHKKLKHTLDIETFPCPVCGKIFNQEWNMKRHIRIHDKE